MACKDCGIPAPRPPWTALAIRTPQPTAPLVDRQRQPNLLDELLVGNRAVVLADHPLDDGGPLRAVVASERGDHGLDVQTESVG